MLLRPSRKVFAEFFGTAILVATVVGSGAMATNISRDRGIQLAINAAATVLALGVLIHLLGDISGAHFNPLVTLAAHASGRISNYLASLYIGAQFVGAFAGCVLANLRFHLPAQTVGALIGVLVSLLLTGGKSPKVDQRSEGVAHR